MNKVLIIYTGGTIGMVNGADGVLVPFNFEQIKENVPELARLNYQFDVHSFHPVLDSSNMDPEIWKTLAELIYKNYHLYDGFVILHGSDTMAFTSSALSFMLENLAKPVVLTGSQLPIGEIRTDAKENLITALEIAAKKENDSAVVPEVCIYFDAQLFRGNRAIKYNSEKFEAFRSPNYPILAEAGVHLQFNSNYILKNLGGTLKLHTNFNANIGVLKLYPGITKEAVEAITASKVDAIILETFGSGNASTVAWFLESLRSAINAGKLIVDISQCKKGSVQLGRYETSRILQQIGVLSGFDLTFEATVTKLMFVLGLGVSMDEMRHLMETSLRGELTAG
ncbi:L-asparaginase [Pedobacter sp. UYP30]|uniref:asparaginase n=1 Tax=Pedobacter sp. UYP30 TaxID=1756400 RepID=UPI0033914C35